MQKHIYIIYTGGTIGMQRTGKGYCPKTGLLQEKMATISTLKDPDMPRYTLHVCENLIDSADATPALWNEIALLIATNYEKYDGFIVFHGTDTMAYSASALSFMLENLAKPVIFTGSQVPLSEVRNDARDNLVNALYIANHYDIPEVTLYFKNRLFRANRTQKISSQKFQAFRSPNFPTLADIAIDIHLRENLLQPIPTAAFSAKTVIDSQIIWLPLFPGINLKLFANVFSAPTQAIVLDTFGSGNPPINNPELWPLLKTALASGIIILNHTQCVDGGVKPSSYSGGQKLVDAGVISTADMTIEATIAKLYYLFSSYQSPTKIKQLLPINLRGELTTARMD